MYKKILVPLDGSELSESVMEHVITIARGCRVPGVVLVQVREPLDEDVRKALDAKIAAELDQAYRDEAAGYLKKIAARLKKEGITAEIEVLAGNPAEEIIKYAGSSGVDLIIMSTHGRSGFSRWVFGSVADKVIRQTEVPVLIRPAGGRDQPS
jgi:nucleotide-binding universal stress UspA family protein